MKRDKMFWNGREHGEAIHMAEKDDLKGGATFYAIKKRKEDFIQ